MFKAGWLLWSEGRKFFLTPRNEVGRSEVMKNEKS